jgi:hypothetical protein
MIPFARRGLMLCGGKREEFENRSELRKMLVLKFKGYLKARGWVCKLAMLRFYRERKRFCL